MKYKVIINDQAYKVSMSDEADYITEGEKDIIEFSINDNLITYVIKNASARTQYLLDNNKLGICFIVKEGSISWTYRFWRSKHALRKHCLDHCLMSWPITSLTGTIDCGEVSWYRWAGCFSKTLYYIFNMATTFQDPYVAEGYEDIKLGIGRYNPHQMGGMRPHMVSKYKRIQVTNKIDY